jgi:hypothetical protein
MGKNGTEQRPNFMEQDGRREERIGRGKRKENRKGEEK